VPKTIKQSVTLPATAAQLFTMYLDSKQHAAITGAAASVSAKAGSVFRAFGGQLSGKTLHTVPKKLIVQAWRSSGWKSGDPDSVLVLMFSPVGDSGRIDLVHINVPDHDAKGVTQGWKKYYWTPWREYLKRR